jgi:hypothetical protein
MMRSGHYLYDLRELLGSPKLLMPLLLVAGFFIFFASFQFIYIFVLLYGAIFATRAVIGRRCPQCDGPLQEAGAERDKTNAFVMVITWRCPRDGYEEKETVKGGSGLFGAD